MNVAVLGTDTLAAAIRTCCEPYVALTSTSSADVVWVAHDTPIGPGDEPDSEWVVDRIREAMPEVSPRALVLISSQMPVGTCAALEAEFPEHRFAVSPENVRAAHAVDDFRRQDRIVIGIRRDDDRAVLEELLQPFTDRIIVMSPESAEMTKHGINAWLALSITFINELAAICDRVGADPNDVSVGLMSDGRIGSRAYLRPGGPYTGGHLGRDVAILDGHSPGPVIAAIKPSNDAHLLRLGRDDDEPVRRDG